MKTKSLNRDWTLRYQQPGEKAVVESIELPHDWSISKPRRPDAPSGASGGYFQGAELHYERSFFVDRFDETVLLEFEGVYCNAEVRVNGHLVDKNRYGYSGFIVDASRWVEKGAENRLKVVVNANARPDSRWYTGAGIYRFVWLHTAGREYIHPWGLTVETQQVEETKAELEMVADIIGVQSASILEWEVLDARGTSLLKETSRAYTGSVRQKVTLPNPKPWSAKSPYLYKICCTLWEAGTKKDTKTATFGIRTLTLDAVDGLQINGDTVKLKGGCVHHDNGILGAASFPAAEERKVRLLKENGFNAVRCAHNPPSPAFLRACDKLGLYVMNEAFDVWREGKNPYDYHNFFDTDWEKDVTAMVLRDRRHPSVIMWSTGNEIPERDGRLDGYKLAKQLYQHVKRLDNTRPVTNCLCNVSTNTEITGLEANLMKEDPAYDLWAKRTKPFTEFLDVVGYNYLLTRYEGDGEKFPNRVICGAESFPLEAAKNWEAVNKFAYVIGDFVWTAIDYFGESGLGHVKSVEDQSFLRQYPWHQANCGDISICGNKRPQSYYRDAVWGIDQNPCIAVLPPEQWGKEVTISSWGWQDLKMQWDFPQQEGKKTSATVYSSCEKVELFLNGKSLGKKPAGKEYDYQAEFLLTYEPGTLEAVSYQQGVVQGETVLQTPEAPKRIKAFCDKIELSSEEYDIAYVEISITDEKGIRVSHFDKPVSVFVSGAGKLVALGTDNPASAESYTAVCRKAYQGRVLGAVQGIGKGEISVTIVTEGIPATTITLLSV